MSEMTDEELEAIWDAIEKLAPWASEEDAAASIIGSEVHGDGLAGALTVDVVGEGTFYCMSQFESLDRFRAVKFISGALRDLRAIMWLASPAWTDGPTTRMEELLQGNIQRVKDWAWDDARAFNAAFIARTEFNAQPRVRPTPTTE